MDEQDKLESQAASRSVGELLRAAREAADLSRADVAARTRVAERYLAAIEDNRFGDLAAPTYAVGFSRAYARAVGLDEADIAKRVRRQLDAQSPKRPVTMPSFEPGDPARVPPSRIAWIAGAFIIVVVGLLLLYWNSYLSPEGRLPDLLPDATPTASQAAPAQAPAPAAPAPAQGPVVLTAMAPNVWIKVTDAAGAQLIQRELAQGESFTVPPEAKGAQLRTGRPDVLQISVGGQALPPLSDKPRLVSGISLEPASLLERARGVPAPTPTASNATTIPAASTAVSPEAARATQPGAEPRPRSTPWPRSTRRASRSAAGMDDILGSRSSTAGPRAADGMPEPILPPAYPVSTASH
jgi:transcriptional regulator with XRE-family HTH domain